MYQTIDVESRDGKPSSASVSEPSSNNKHKHWNSLFIVLSVCSVLFIAGYSSFASEHGSGNAMNIAKHNMHSQSSIIEFDSTNDDANNDDSEGSSIDSTGEFDVATDAEMKEYNSVYPLLPVTDDTSPDPNEDDVKKESKQPDDPPEPEMDPANLGDSGVMDLAQLVGNDVPNGKKKLPPDYCYRDTYRKKSPYFKDKYEKDTYVKDEYDKDIYSLGTYDKDIYTFDEYDRETKDKPSYERNKGRDDCRSGYRDLGVGKTCYQNCDVAFGSDWEEKDRFTCFKKCPSGYSTSGVGDKRCKATSCRSGYDKYLVDKCSAQCKAGYEDYMMSQCREVKCRAGYSDYLVRKCRENTCKSGYVPDGDGKCQAICKDGYDDYLLNKCKARCKSGYVQDPGLPDHCISTTCKPDYEPHGNHRCVQTCKDGYVTFGGLGNRCSRVCPLDWITCGTHEKGLGCAQTKKTCVLMKLQIIAAVVAAAVDITLEIATVGTSTPALIAEKFLKADSKVVKKAKAFKAFKYTKRFEQLLKLADVSDMTAEFVHQIIDYVEIYNQKAWKYLFTKMAIYVGITTASLLDPTGLSGVGLSVGYPKCYKSKFYWFNTDKYAEEHGIDYEATHW